jgi:hypothetical protein
MNKEDILENYASTDPVNYNNSKKLSNSSSSNEEETGDLRTQRSSDASHLSDKFFQKPSG